MRFTYRFKKKQYIREQIDLNYGIIEIEKQNNKGHQKIQLPITEKLKQVFDEIGVKEKGYIFTNTGTEEPYKSINRSRYSSLKKANTENFRFHDLRPSVGTRLIEKGADIKTVQEIMTHSSIKATERYIQQI